MARCLEVEMHGDQTVSYIAEHEWEAIKAGAERIEKVLGVYVPRYGSIYRVTQVRHYLIVPRGPSAGLLA